MMKFKALPLVVLMAATVISFAEETTYYGGVIFGKPSLSIKSEYSIYGNNRSSSDEFTDGSKMLGLFIGPHIELGFSDFFERREKVGISTWISIG